MKKSDAIKFYRSQRKVAEILDISEAAVSRWGEDIPIKHAWRLERASKGDLKMRINDYRLKALK